MTKQNYLYRHFDSEGNLLYVGISINPFKRLNEHKQASSWFDKVKNLTIERFESRDQALIAETDAILNEKPIYNIKKTKENNSIYKESQRFQKIIESKERLTRKVIFKTTYSIREAAIELNIGEQKIKEYIKDKKIGSICVGERKNLQTGLIQKKYAITGWQLIEFIENLERESNAS